jgi:cell division protein FtsZ
LREVGGNMSLASAFAMADNVLSTAAKGIADVITSTGAINVDFNDVNTVMRNSGVAIMGSASAEGEGRAMNAVQEALNSPLLNDNNIEGATYILLNITYGDLEVTMDEIGEITDFIQEEAGSTADIIWGHGYDPSLGNKLCITLVATGFNSSPVTGFEKAPARTVRPLEEEVKNEIKAPLTAPTQQIESEPFMKAQPEAIIEVAPKAEIVNEQPQTINFDWEITEEPTLVTPTVVAPREEAPRIIRHELEDEVEAKNSLDSLHQTARTPLSADEMQRRNQERMERLAQYNNKLKKAEGLKELEDEPAFARRNIHLENIRKSDEQRVSRFGLSDNEGLRTNNSFLHDNVD